MDTQLNQKINTMFLGALQGAKDGSDSSRNEALANLRAIASKCHGAGIDIHELHVDKANSSALQRTASIIKENRELRETLSVIQDSIFLCLEVFSNKPIIRTDIKDMMTQLKGKVLSTRKTAPTDAEIKKTKATSFPWSKYPEIERMVVENFLSDNRIPFGKLARDLSKRYGVNLREGPIKQKCNNNAPPTWLINAPLTGAPTWAELWFIGSQIDGKRNWKDNLFAKLGLPNQDVGSSIDHITPEMLRKLREQTLEVSKSNGKTQKFILEILLEAGPEGMTRDQIKKQDPLNKGITRRFSEIVGRHEAFEKDDKLVHSSFAKS